MKMNSEIKWILAEKYHLTSIRQWTPENYRTDDMWVNSWGHTKEIHRLSLSWTSIVNLCDCVCSPYYTSETMFERSVVDRDAPKQSVHTCRIHWQTFNRRRSQRLKQIMCDACCAGIVEQSPYNLQRDCIQIQMKYQTTMQPHQQQILIRLLIGCHRINMFGGFMLAASISNHLRLNFYIESWNMLNVYVAQLIRNL